MKDMREISCYAVKNRNDKVLKKSSSGGVSHALCKEIIERGGIVYGVEYDDQFKVITKRVVTLEECEALYGSKYVQAKPKNTFKEVRNDLLSGKEVLYFGTSCYIAGLLSYLKTSKVDITNLYTVDLICHGTPSPRIFDEYMLWLGQNIQSFQFRTKEKPWGYGSKNFGCTITYKNGKKEIDSLKARVFLTLFFSNNCLRPNCHLCRYAGVEKPSDITIADYWGCKEEEPEFFSEKGVSAVIVHTNKGEKIIKTADELEIKKTSIVKIEKKQGNLDHASPVSENREKFWKLYREKGFKSVARKYGNYSLKAKIKYYLRRHI